MAKTIRFNPDNVKTPYIFKDVNIDTRFKASMEAHLSAKLNKFKKLSNNNITIIAHNNEDEFLKAA